MTYALRLATAAIIVLLATGSASAQLRRAAPLPDYWRKAGETTLHAAVGTNNGARLGVLYYVSERVAPELSLGYVRLTEVYESAQGSTESHSPAWAVTTGVNWYTHPPSDVSPFLSLLGTFVQATKSIEGQRQQRYLLCLTVGTEFYITKDFGGFFRLGPTIDVVRHTRADGTHGGLQMDGGLCITF